MRILLFPLSFLSPFALFAAILMIAVGVKGEPMNLQLAGWGLVLLLLAALTFPRPGHPLHRFFSRKKAKAALREVVDTNVAAVEFQAKPKPFHSGWSRLDLVFGAATPPSSWIGGLPEMPADIPWPEQDGKAAMFLAQISMSDLPEDIWGGLGPKTGWLVFFFAPSDWGGVRVLHAEERAAPRRYPNGSCVENFLSGDIRSAMAELGQPMSAFRPPRLAVTVSPTDEQPPSLLENITKRDELLQKYREIELTDPRLAPFATGDKPSHQTAELLARLAFAQDPSSLKPETRDLFEERWTFYAQCEAATMGGPVGSEFFFTAPKEPILLLRLQSSQLFGWSFGDAQDLGIFISADDLKARKWEKVWFDYTG